MNEIHVKQRLTVGGGSKVLWWASGEDVVLENKLDLPGKIQARSSIQVEGEVHFHHLDAPIIQSGALELKNILGRLEAFRVLPLSLPRQCFAKNLEVAAGEVVEGDLIVKGALTLHENARVNGSVKCHQRFVLEKGACVSGNIVSLGDIECRGANWIGGTILGQKDISFLGGVYVGSENQRVTISGNTIQIRGGFRSHGSIRAWKLGRIGF